jgi:uncharacterized protein (DUF58 family)
MIVPQNRLLLLAGCILLPMSLAEAAVPALLPPLLGILALAAVVSLLDALHSTSRIAGVRVEFPERVNIPRNSEESLPITVHDDRGNGGALRLGLGLGLPHEVHSPRREMDVVLPSNRTGLKINWPVCAQKRGEYLLSKCAFRFPSRLGLWSRQGSFPASTLIRVYPDLLHEYRKVSALFLRRHGAGILVHRQVGQGRDCEKLRDYLPGDSMSDIHWRVTAKRSRLVTKEYQLERTQEVYVVIDASRLSTRPSYPTAAGTGAGEPLLERYISSALTLGDFARRQGDRFGLIAYSNRILRFIRAGGGKLHYRTCRDALLDLHPETVTPDFEELASTILQNLRRRALLLLLTSLDDPSLAESFLSQMEAVSRRHVLIVNMIKPPLAEPVFSDRNVTDIEDIYRRLGGHMLRQDLRSLEVLLRRRGIDLALTNRENLCVQMVSRYVDIKRRQVL